MNKLLTLQKTVILISILLISSCGTIIKTNEEVISIDSQGRGREVFNEKEKSIGKTPFFYQIEKKRNQKFYILESSKISENYQCQFDFSESLFPNVLTGILNLPMGAIALSIDWYNGNIYKCRNSVFFKNSNLNEQELPPNKNVLIIPPFTKNHLEAKNIEQILLNKKKIDHFNLVNLDLQLSQIGITSFSDNQISKINFNLINPLLKKHQITHLMFFKITESDHKKIAKPVLVDAFSHLTTNDSFKDIIIDEREDSLASKYLAKFHFIPNSLKMTTASFANDKSIIQTSPHPHAIPKIFSIFSVGNVYSPYLYDSWDYDLYSSTIFALPAWKSTYLNQQYLFQSFTGLLNGGLLLKTPVGALSFEFGYGAMFFYEKPSNLKDRVHPNFDISVSYAFYFTKKLFFNAQYLMFSPVNVGINFQPVKVQISTIGIGYYFPEGENLFRENF